MLIVSGGAMGGPPVKEKVLLERGVCLPVSVSIKSSAT